MFDRTLLPNPQAYYGQFFALKGSKKQQLVLCCFHHEKTPSLSINLQYGSFNCLGCGVRGGDVLDFHQQKTGLNFVESCKDLGAWTDTTQDTPDQLAARKAKIEQANKEYKAKQVQAAKAEKAHAQAFIPLVSNILKQCTKPMLDTPYCVAKSINSHNLTSITATDIQRFTLPKDPHDTDKRPVTVCYGFEGVLTVAMLETLEGETVALQAFDGVPDVKGKYARWLIGKPVVMGAYYRLGDFASPSVVLITEGVADAISCYEATGYPVLAAISKSQLLNAAKAVKGKYPQALIVICGDNDLDGGGEDAAIAAAPAVNGLVVIPEGVKDFNDLHQVHGLEAVKMTIDAAIESKKAAPSDTEDAAHKTNNDRTGGIPKGHLAKPMLYGKDRFEILPNGIFFVEIKDNDEKDYQFVSSSILVKAQTRTNGGRAWGRLLEWQDPDKNVHQWAMPMELLQGDCADVRRELADKGVQINPSKRGRDRLAIYLQNYPIDARALCVERLGWHEDVYILPKYVIGNSDELTVFQNPHGLESPFAQSGTVEQWRNTVARFAIGNSRFIFVLSFAFAAPLAELVNEQGGGIHFRGASSTGKSTLLDAACSVFGKPKTYKHEWRNTANAIEGLCALHNDGLVVLDEINQCDHRTVGQTVYMVANGQSKGRMGKNLTTRPVNQWRVMLLSAGEKSLSDMLKLAGQQINAGQEIRLADIAAEVTKGSIFEQLHDTDNGASFSQIIKEATYTHYGTVGLAWLEWIASQRKSLISTSTLKKRIDEWLSNSLPTGASGQVSRVASRFALIAVSGELATEQGLTGWPTGAANDAAKVCFEDWLLSFGGISNHEDRAILAHVKSFFEAHGSSRFESCHVTATDKPERVINRAGYWKQNENSKCFLVLPEQFTNEVCKGYDKAQVIRVLSDKGILLRGSGNKSTKQERVPDLKNPIRVYVINLCTRQFFINL